MVCYALPYIHSRLNSHSNVRRKNKMSTHQIQEVVALREQAVKILDRLDELTLSFDDPELKLALQRAINKLQNADLNLRVFDTLE